MSGLYFCSQGCYNDFFINIGNKFIAIAPKDRELKHRSMTLEKRKDCNGWIYNNNWIVEEPQTMLDLSHMIQDMTDNKEKTRRNRFNGQSVKLTKQEADFMIRFSS